MASNLASNPFVRTEYDAWQRVCDKLLEAGAVTTYDLKSPQSANERPGQLLLNIIREWGEQRVKLELFLVREELRSIRLEAAEPAQAPEGDR